MTMTQMTETQVTVTCDQDNHYPDEQDPFDNTLTALKVDGNEK
jgi:hypothetical protein